MNAAKFLLVVPALALCACDQSQPDPQVVPMATPAATECPVKVTRIAVFNDSLAYQGQRGVYEIVDESTGQRWIGVSGVGIAERGAHSERQGKQEKTVPDER